MAELSFTEEVARDMLKEIQSWWEIPALAQYISLFREPFNLPEIEIEELEKGFVDDTCNGPSTWLQNLIIAFLNSILPSRINLENWEIHLRKLIRRKWPKDEPNPFDEDRSFRELTVRSKVVIVYSLCLYRLDRNDIAELMKSMHAEALRVQKLGVDSAGNTYWYFYGTRLYKEEPGKKKSWDEEWKQQKNNSFKKRGRGRPRKKTLPTSDGESEDFDTFDFNKKEGYMNVSSKSRWSVVCDTIEEWIDLTEKFKDSKSKEEISLFKIIQENFLPTLNKIYEEKERKFQQKIRDLMPVREKIVTRRETRKMRGEDVDYSPANGYSSDEVQRHYPTKDRAQRLEERNKRASEAMDSLSYKKIKSNASTDESSISSFDPGSDGKPNDLQSQIEKLLTSVKLHKDSWPFLFPVNEVDAPGYYEIIKEPVDLSLIESRLYAGDYETVGNLDADFSKMVANCELYNGEFHPYSKMAQMLRIVFRKGVAKILESMQLSENSVDDSDGSSDSQYHSNSNSDSPPLEFPAMSPIVVVHKKSKEKKKRKNSSEALDLLAAASDIAVQDSFVSRTSPPSKKSLEPEPQQPAASTHVPLPSMPFTPASASHSNISKPGPKPVSIPSNNFVQEPGKEKSVIVKNKPKQNMKRKPTENVTPTSLNVASSTNTNNVVVQCNNVTPTSLNVASSTNTNNVVVQRNTNNAVSPNNVYQTFNSKAVPVVFSYNNATPSTQSDLQFKSNSGAVATAQSIPNTLPVVQQVILPSGQQIQVQNGGQFLFASPQNSGGIFNKEQNVQFINAGQVNPGFGKMVPQFITSTPVLQVSKDVMPGLQFQTVSQNSNQAFTQVTASPQFINVPTYLLANQNAIAESPQQSAMNHYQLPQRQMHIAGQGIQ